MINQLFDVTTLAYSERAAIVYEERDISYFELQVYVEWMGRYFQSIGLQPGHRIAVYMPNCPEMIIALLGLIGVGGIAVPLDVSEKGEGIKALIKIAKIHAVITIPTYQKKIDAILDELKGSDNASSKLPMAVFEEDNIVTLGKTPLVQIVIEHPKSNESKRKLNSLNGANGSSSMKDQEENCGHSFSEQAAFLLCESNGSTHLEPKLYTHNQIVRKIEQFNTAMQVTLDDIFLCVMPLTHPESIIYSLMSAIVAGAKVVLLDHFDQRNVMKVLIDNRITIYSGLISMFRSLVDHPSNTVNGKTSLRLCLAPCATVSPEINATFHNRFGIDINEFKFDRI